MPTDVDQKLIRPRLAQIVASDAVNYLDRHQVNGKVKVWVFFTDKAVYSKQQMQSAALSVSQGFSERTLARRARNGVSAVQFSDLPVHSQYVDLVSGAGAQLRRVSRYLNAASFEVSPSKLGLIGAFPFVAKIEPVAYFKRIADVPAQTEKQPIQKQALDAAGLIYGSSYAQLNQIAVTICHDSGYNGAGVLISMFDSGFRKSHSSFTRAYAEGRVLAEWDFIFNDSNVSNEAEDDASAWSHGTSTWSTCGGENPGTHYGPAYKASFILCKTEDIRSETPVEEDNWVAAMEWVDSLGTDIISSSLGYSDWYTQAQYNGRTCISTLAAVTAQQHGILVCNSVGNNGPGSPSLSAPGDADSILAVGAVSSSGAIVSFSSRGPTVDGRIKPEVCALGSSDYVASSSSDAAYTYSSGTSFSCPLTAGAAALVIQAHPTWTNQQVRWAMMMTASNAATPNNNYGWGIINTWAAIHYSYAPPSYVHGDADGDAMVNISDAVFLVNYIFAGGPAPSPLLAGDADCSGIVGVSDAVYIISYIFGDGPAPC
jgi:subtilisin family serine protease